MTDVFGIIVNISSTIVNQINKQTGNKLATYGLVAMVLFIALVIIALSINKWVIPRIAHRENGEL